MGICERQEIGFIRQDLQTPQGVEERWLVVHLLEIEPGVFKPTHYGPELTGQEYAWHQMKQELSLTAQDSTPTIGIAVLLDYLEADQ